MQDSTRKLPEELDGATIANRSVIDLRATAIGMRVEAGFIYTARDGTARLVCLVEGEDEHQVYNLPVNPMDAAARQAKGDSSDAK